MGSLFGGRVSSTDSYKKDPRNPNPLLFELKQAHKIGDFVIAAINYIGCTNYEGNKILVFKGLSEDEFMNLKEIDPHFTEGSKLVARFEPTKSGMEMALYFARCCTGY
jgi:hypothetical protein